MKKLFGNVCLLLLTAILVTADTNAQTSSDLRVSPDSQVTLQLRRFLNQNSFTGTVGKSLTGRLGRPINQNLADLGRMLFFDKISSLHSDNSCSGCHSPTNGFGDTQHMAVGINNNGIAGPGRAGPRNQRRTPQLLNVAFYPKLMWNGRFSTLSGDPFDTSAGFQFPVPEGTTYFSASDPKIYHLLVAHSHMPPTEVTEAAGFTGTSGTIGPMFDQFDDGLGSPVPLPDADGSRNEPIRQAVLQRLNSSAAYKQIFAAVFPEVANGSAISSYMFGQAVAEFEFTLNYANAPLDQFARGDNDALSNSAKRGAVLFFGSARCVQCHSVSGNSNEMFSDFQNHSIGVPPVAPVFGVGTGNVLFDGPGQDEDFGEEQISGNSLDRYTFRTAPLRNMALQPAYFHNGAFTKLEDAVQHHLNTVESLRRYDPAAAGLPPDLTSINPPRDGIMNSIDPLSLSPVTLSPSQFADLITFLRDGLLDKGAKNLCAQIPASLPSGATLTTFQGCSQ